MKKIFQQKNNLITIITSCVIISILSCTTTSDQPTTSSISSKEIKLKPVQNLPTKRLSNLLFSWEDSLTTKVQILKEKNNSSRKISIVINQQQDTLSFDNRLMTFLSDISKQGKQGNKVKILILADKDLPFGIIRYFEFLLRLNNISRIGYGNIHHENFVNAFPPIPQKVFRSSMDKNKIWRIKNFDASAITILQSYGIDSIQNCKLEYQKFLLKAENVLQIKVDSTFEEATLNQQLTNLFKDKLWHKKIVELITNDSVNYELIFNVQSQILTFFNDLRDRMSHEDFDMAFNDLDKKRQKEIKNKIPMVFSQNHYSSIKIKK